MLPGTIGSSVTSLLWPSRRPIPACSLPIGKLDRGSRSGVRPLGARLNVQRGGSKSICSRSLVEGLRRTIDWVKPLYECECAAIRFSVRHSPWDAAGGREEDAYGLGHRPLPIHLRSTVPQQGHNEPSLLTRSAGRFAGDGVGPSVRANSYRFL